ncbi:hypothetical protein AgCh_032026 [Apium graveolens]
MSSLSSIFSGVADWLSQGVGGSNSRLQRHRQHDPSPSSPDQDFIKEKMENGNDACGHSQKKEPLDGKAS